MLASTDGKRRRYRGREVVLSAGAIQSPTILMRSGVGPEQHLRKRGIPVVAALDGVGANLQNHPVVYLAAHVRPEGRQSPSLRPGFNTGLRMSSGPEPEYRSDTMIMVLNKSSWHGLGSAVAGLGVCLLRPTSRGSVRLRQDPSAYPEIDFNMLAADDDRRRLVHGFGVAAQLMMDDEVRALRNEAFATGYSRVVRGLNKPGRVNSAVTKLLSGMLDGPRAIRRLMLKWGIASGDIDERRMADPAWLRSTVERRSFGTYHPAGTCALGDPEAPPSSC